MPRASPCVLDRRDRASIGTGGLLTVGGDVSATALQTATATTTAEGAAKGSDVGVGVTIALAVVNHIVESILDRSLTSNGGGASFSASGASTSVTKAKASVAGAKNDSDNSSDGDGDTKAKADAQLGDANTRSSQNTGKSSGSTSTPEAATGDSGGGSVSVAGAIAVNIHHSTSKAWLGLGQHRILDVTGPASFTSLANTDAKADADGSVVDAGSAGVGAAVAINFVDMINLAGVGMNAGVSSSGLTITALMRTRNAETTHTFESIANAGAGSEDVGVAGALALNIVSATTEALVNQNPARGPPGVDAGNGTVTISAAATEKDVAKATANAEGGDAGVGASVALNIIYQTKVRAEIADDATFTGGTTLTVSATGVRTVETTVEAGAKSDQVAVTPAVALALDKDDKVIARIGSTPGRHSPPRVRSPSTRRTPPISR